MPSRRFEMRVEQSLLERIDAWRARQSDLPSRAEAFRRLTEAGLDRLASDDFSKGEKLLAMMMRDLYRHLGVKGEVDPNFTASIFAGGNTWAIDEQPGGVLRAEPVPHRVVKETIDILTCGRY